jgi:hypothetical protein
MEPSVRGEVTADLVFEMNLLMQGHASSSRRSTSFRVRPSAALHASQPFMLPPTIAAAAMLGDPKDDLS